MNSETLFNLLTFWSWRQPHFGSGEATRTAANFAITLQKLLRAWSRSMQFMIFSVHRRRTWRAEGSVRLASAAGAELQLREGPNGCEGRDSAGCDGRSR